MLIEMVDGKTVMNVFRKGDKFYSVEKCPFGEYIAPVEPQEVYRQLGASQIRALGETPAWNSIPSVENFEVEYEVTTDCPQVNRSCYVALTKWYLAYCGKIQQTNEVGAKIFISPSNELEFLVPVQSVCGGSVQWVNSQNSLTHILTGEEGTEAEWMKKGYRYVGLSHSHNTMALSNPSGIDDKQEIGVPGIYFLHSNFKPGKDPSYVQTITLTTGAKRFWFPDIENYCPVLTREEWESEIVPHPNCDAVVTLPVHFGYQKSKTRTPYYPVLTPRYYPSQTVKPVRKDWEQVATAFSQLVEQFQLDDNDIDTLLMFANGVQNAKS